jgi:eukaryotic-like serine/threonine-protein kinase
MSFNRDNLSDSDATTDLNDRRPLQGLEPSAANDHLSLSFDESSLGPGSIGRYRILKELGQGAFGKVYQALDETLNRHVAVKLLTKFDDVNQLESWLSEARVLAGLDHPSIVPIFDVGRTELGQPYIVSKLIEGGSLTARRGDKEWTLKDSVRVVLQLSKALEYLHSRGVVHRDIKPGNILTTAEGNAVLADFGLAMAEESYGKGSRFVGTPAYMSPEQARLEGHRVDGRSDIYSLGVVFYELISGTRPFAAKDREELLDCIRSVEVRPLRQLRPEVPRELERICLKMLSKKVSDRYTTAGDLSEELQYWDSSASQMPSKTSIAIEPASTYASSDTLQLVEPQSTARTLDIETVAVVPHGLRPFDTTDADFFRYLLPGARNRDGVPESILFWVNRIVSRNEGQTFRNGVLMGPSGSGKSSLMRAGVLPLVDKEVLSVYLEAKPESLEKDLAKQIRQHFAFLGGKESLQETLTRVRQHISTRSWC